MSRIFNTPFEISLRALIILEIAGQQWKTADMIAATDFIAIYAKDFGITKTNLHGDNTYKFSEIALLRDLVNKAVRLLVKNGLIYASSTNNGLSYLINQKGMIYSEKLNNEYAETYRRLARQAQKYIADKSEPEILKLINNHALSSLKGRVNDV